MGIKDASRPCMLTWFAKSMDHEDLRNMISASRNFYHGDRVSTMDATTFSNFLRPTRFAKHRKEPGIKMEPGAFTKASPGRYEDAHRRIGEGISNKEM